MKRLIFYSLIGLTLLLKSHIAWAEKSNAFQEGERANIKRGVEIWNAINQQSDSYTLPSLWVLAVGLSQYKKETLNLKYADADALSIAEILKKQEGLLFGKVHIKMLVNDQATRVKIIEGFDFLNQAGPDDTVFIFIAGHGVKLEVTGSYYFLPYAAHQDNLLAEGLLWSHFQEAVSILNHNVKKVILAIDTCRAGALEIAWRGRGGNVADLAAQFKEAEGLFTLAASKAGEDSLENDQCKHGVFTCTILDAFTEGDFSKDGVLMVSELFQYVSRKVPQLSNGKQHPYQNFSGTDLPIAVVGEVNIPAVKNLKSLKKNNSLFIADGTASLYVDSQPGGADIFLDGWNMNNRTPAILKKLPEGKHEIELHKTGYSVAKLTVELDPYDLRKLENVKLGEEIGNIRIYSSKPGAEVYIDGKKIGTSPLRQIGLKTGSHILKLKAKDENTFYEYEENIVVVMGENEYEINQFKETKLKITNRLDQEFILIQAGEFKMGSNNDEGNEKPEHQVYLDAFYIGKHEVTVGEYKQFLQKTKYRGLPSWVSEYSPNDNYPVVGVSWYDAVAYCEWLSKEIGKEYRLPSEAEWEKAARGTDGRKYPWGNQAPDAGGQYLTNYDPGEDDADGYKYNAQIASYESDKSPYGVYNMAGNVQEWCADWYSFAYNPNSSARNPRGADNGVYRVLRGGSWKAHRGHLRCAKRFKESPSRISNSYGFRLVYSLTDQ